MATLNVFEVTNSELSKALKESVKPVKKTAKKAAKKVNESKKVGAKFAKKTIGVNKIKLESMQFFKENEVLVPTFATSCVCVLLPQVTVTR